MSDSKTICDDLPFGVLRADALGCASYANAACAEITGLMQHQLLAYGWLETIHPADRARVVAEWREACASLRKLETRCRIVMPDASRRFVRLSICPQKKKGPSPGHAGIWVDVTDRVLAERRLRRNNELLTAVLENIPSGITVFGPEGRLILDNQKARLLLSLPDDPDDGAITDFGTLAVDRSPDSLYYPDSAPWALNDSAQRGPRIREELQPDGRVLEVRDARMPTGGIVTTYTDITEHKQSIEKLQQAKTDAEQAAAAKAAFLATMSHEIRTPMNGVIGMTSVLLDSRLTRDQREIVEVIRQSGESLLVVINDILDYSKIESGQMKLEWLPLRLEEVVDNCLRLLGPKAKEKGVILSVDMDRRIPSLILGDRTRLQQVLMNLLSNAVKFTQHGTVRVTLVEANSGSDHTASNETGDICEVSVAVEDSGIGIPQEKLTGIFEPFVQADSSTARRFGGTGLGLAIAKRLVEAMGGQISIESEVGRGTRACFSFLAEAAIPSGIATPISDAPLWQKKVLLIAGSRADVRVLMTALVRWGMEVDTCSGTSEGSSRLAGNERFDLVLAATHMTEARWQTFVQALRETGVGVPAILLSRTRKVTSVDNALGARILARSCTEATLYDALVDAMEFGGERPFSEFPERLQFDDSLGQAAPLRILVAEDNEINRKVVLRMLAGFGYQADVAQNGEQVIDLISQRSYDLVLMDVQMPKVDGIEATKFIVENIPAARRPRVVAMSANVMREEVDAALAAGADHYIAKPFAPSELRATLEESANRLSVAAAPTWRSAPQVLSLDRLRSHLAGDPTGAFLAELSADFSRVSAQLQCRLQEATDARDVQRLGSTVHEYLGVCAVVGAEKLMQLLLRLQKTIRAGTLKAAAVLVERSQSLQEQTVQELQAAASKHRERAAGIRSDGQVIPLSRDKKR